MGNLLKAILFTVILGQATILSAQQIPAKPNWNVWEFILGEWIGEGSGAPGENTGSFTFALDLQNTVLVRKNHTDFPATKDRPTFLHDDLLIVYQENNSAKAIYFDNEGYVINYAVEFSKDSSGVIFVSEVNPSAPRFRLTYTKMSNDKLNITFEIAQPGKPEAFSKYLEGIVRKK